MADLVRVDLNGGAVITRADHALAGNELVSAAGMRYKHGDPTQIHRDMGRTEHSEIVGGVVDAEYLAFENFSHILLGLQAVTDGAGFPAVQLQYIQAHQQDVAGWQPLGDAISVDKEEEAATQVAPSEMAAIHRGDEYFIGTGSTPRVLRQTTDGPVVKRMGMRVPEKFFGFADTETTYEFNSDPRNTLVIQSQRVKAWSELGIGIGIGLYEGQPFLNGNYSADWTLPIHWPSGSGDQNLEGRTDYWHVYYITEYDKEHDLESQPIAILPVIYQTYANNVIDTPNQGLSDTETRLNVEIASKREDMTDEINVAISYITANFSSYAKMNERTTHIRIYRQYIGTSTSGPKYSHDRNKFRQTIAALWGDEAQIIKNRGASNERIWLTSPSRGFVQGSLMETVDLSSAQSVQLAPLDYSAGGPGPATEYYGLTDILHSPPKPFTCGAVFEDKLVLNIVGEPTVLQYSVAGQPEYFPSVNILPLLSDGEDRILQIHNLDNFLLITTPGAIHRLDYLPGFSDPNRAPLSIISTDGCVGNRASTVVTLPQGTALIWLSESQLNLSTGKGSVNVCEDWSVDAAGLDVGRLSDAVLVNNTRVGRLELYVAATGEQAPQARYDFYYSRLHMKGTGFKMLGPTPVAPAVDHALVAASADRASPVWLGTSDGMWYNSNVGISTVPVDLQLARMFVPGSPLHRVTPMLAALQHSALLPGDEKLTMTFEGKTIGKTANDLRKVRFTGHIYDEVDIAQITAVTGNYVNSHIKFAGPDDVSLGPLYLDVEVSGDGR